MGLKNTIIEREYTQYGSVSCRLTSPGHQMLSKLARHEMRVLLYSFGNDYAPAVGILARKRFSFPGENFYFIARARVGNEVWAFPMSDSRCSCYLNFRERNPALEVPEPEQVEFIDDVTSLHELQNRDALRFRHLAVFSKFIDSLLDTGNVVLRAHFASGNPYFRGRESPQKNYCKVLATSWPVTVFDWHLEDWEILKDWGVLHSDAVLVPVVSPKVATETQQEATDLHKAYVDKSRPLPRPCSPIDGDFVSALVPPRAPSC